MHVVLQPTGGDRGSGSGTGAVKPTWHECGDGNGGGFVDQDDDSGCVAVKPTSLATLVDPSIETASAVFM